MSDTGSRVELLRALAVVAEPPEPGHAGIAASLGLTGAPEPSAYADVFLFQLYPYASVHLGPEGMMGGVARERVAGFWTALGYTAPTEPDHLAALVGLYADLSAREAGCAGAERALLRESRSALMHEHLAPWIFAFLDRMAEIAPEPYRGWATLLGDVLAAEDVFAADDRYAPDDGRAAGCVRRLHGPAGALDGAAAVDPLSVHLRTTEGIDDPRVAGAPAFLESLLAPVRSGMILTRADLARFAAEADAGLRAGERRYALEHLLAQRPAEMLDCLATEAARQGAMHDGRMPLLGAVARTLSARCRATETLLRELAEDDAPEGIDRGDVDRPDSVTAPAGPTPTVVAGPGRRS